MSADGGPAGERLTALFQTPERTGLLRGLMPPTPSTPGSEPAPIRGPGPVPRRWGVPPRAAVAVVLLCLSLSAGVLARFALGGESNHELLPIAVADTASSSAPSPVPSRAMSPAAAPASAPASAASPSGATVLVHVVGAVHAPGVVAVPGGARVLDAVEAAGGALRKAQLGLVNLARPVVDGEQIRIPARGETVAATAPGGGGASSGGAAGPATGGPSLVDLNTADASALEALPGVGPVLAGRILQWRSSNGRFTSVDELAEIQGIGDRLLEGLRELVSVS